MPSGIPVLQLPSLLFVLFPHLLPPAFFFFFLTKGLLLIVLYAYFDFLLDTSLDFSSHFCSTLSPERGIFCSVHLKEELNVIFTRGRAM